MSEHRDSKIVHGAIGEAVMTVADGLGCSAIEARNALLAGLGHDGCVTRAAFKMNEHALRLAHHRANDERDRAEKAEAEADRLREALVRVGYSVAGAHPEAMRKIARTALNAEDREDDA